MPSVSAIIQYGDVSNFRLVDEPDLLVQALTITPTREKQVYKGVNQAVQAVRFSNPILTFAFNAIPSELSGLANAHPGAMVPGLENYGVPIHEFDPEQGVLIYEDPVRSYSLDEPCEVDFNVVHYPFISQGDVEWSDGSSVLWSDGSQVQF